ncbi:MAG: hypothetical protein KA138_14685 [Saprospiraceae bacterium]|nr:hypothetical protein [Lewinellaceae bacterium]MBP6812771.1 hypothetical protein [Saprospiraceae bacterium]
MATVKTYENNVFINCPFDEKYTPIFNAILFTVRRCGFVLRCAKEYSDSNQIRIDKIVQLIAESKYAIHDLSRVTLQSTNELPRFNMPLELGIFIGCSKFGTKKHREKSYLILESEDYRFKRFISDLSGQDIESHKDNPEVAVKCVRNWLSNKTNVVIPSHSRVWEEFQEFNKGLPGICELSNWVPEELTFGELASLVTTWVEQQS